MCDEPVTVRNYLHSQRHRRRRSTRWRRPRRRDRRGDDGDLADPRRRPPHARETTGGHAERGQRRHAAAAPARLARGPARRLLDARRRRVDPPPPGRPHRRAAARDGREGRGARGPPPADDGRGRAELTASTTELPVASAQVKSCVLLAGLLRRRRDHGHRAGAVARPHRAPAPPRARAVRARRAHDDGLARATSWSST